jgi:hypothetical protein
MHSHVPSRGRKGETLGEFTLEQSIVITAALANGKLVLRKECNAPVNIGKKAEFVFVQQLAALGYEIAKVKL